MSLFRIFRLIQNRPNRTRDPLLTPQSSRNLTRIGLAWYGSACVVGLLAQNLSLRFESCRYCMHVAEWVPSILVMAQGSYDPDAMRFVLFYHALSAPIWLILMWIYGSDFRRYTLQWWGYPFLVGVFVFAGYVSVYGLAFGVPVPGTKELLGQLYHDSLLVSTLVTTGCWSLFVHLIYFFWFYLVGIRTYRWFLRMVK